MRQLRPNRIVFAAALSAAAIAAGCGGGGDDVNNNADDYDGTESEVAGLVDDFANAGRDGDGTKICDDIFSKELASNVEKEAGQSCASEVEDNLPKDKYELEVDSLELKGDTATVGVTDQDDNSSVLHIQRIDNAWRIASVTPAV
jgi:hypothetical protein